MDPTQEELLNLTEELIIAIGSHDWERYIELCDPTISAFEPEAVGHLVYGLGLSSVLLPIGNWRNARSIVPHRSTRSRNG